MKLWSKEAPECMHSFIYDYFEKRYIGLLDPKNQVRKVPFFPIKLWSVHQRVLSGLPRTNNSVEAWHKAFAMPVKSHPTTDKLIEQFKLEQRETEKLLSQISVDGEHERRKDNLKKDKRIYDVVKSCSHGNMTTTMNDLRLILSNYD